MTTKQLQQLSVALKSKGSIPVAYDESKDKNRFWDADPCDDVIPTVPGFVSDCTYYTRGCEVASLFVVWSSLFAIASAVKRDAWMKWRDSQLYANLYIMICAPAGAVKKNTAIDLAVDLLDYLDDDVREIANDPNIEGMKRINPFVSKASPEALITAMAPGAQRATEFVFTDPNGNPIYGADGDPLKYYPRSEIAICQHEMISFVGKSSYMESLIPFLLNVYDAPLRWSNNTQVRGKEELREVLVNFIGGITPAALKLTLPEAATADGFLSRCLVVYQSHTEREYFRPVIPDGAPSKDELRKRLAWIAANTFGEWDFAPDAEDWARSWYHRYKQQLNVDGLLMGINSRKDTILYRVALLIRWARYDRSDRLVHVQDLIDAERLIFRTSCEAIGIHRMLLDSRGGDKSLKTEEFISRVKKISRTELIQRAHVPAEDAYYAVMRLASEGLIEITLDGKKINESLRNPKEIYQWIAPEPDNRKFATGSSPVVLRKKKGPING
jgi:hypothetical protein